MGRNGIIGHNRMGLDAEIGYCTVSCEEEEEEEEEEKEGMEGSHNDVMELPYGQEYLADLIW